MAIIDFLLSLGWWSLLLVLGFYALFLLTWTLYVAIMSIADRLDRLHWFARLNGYLLLAIGYPVDAIFNLVASLVVFQRLPKAWLFTGTLRYWRVSDDRRRSKWAVMVCEKLLNPFDPGHC